MHLFAYGTLMDPAVWNRVAQEECRCEFAALADHEARRLAGHPFPGLVEAAGGRTPGLIYYDVSAAAMARLDAYEDDFYRRVSVAVHCRDGAAVEAQVYLMAEAERRIVLPERWIPDFPVLGERWS